MKKKLHLLFILPFFIFCFQNKIFSQCWNNDNVKTYTQVDWSNNVDNLLTQTNFTNVYNGSFVIGTTPQYYVLFDVASALQQFFPQLGNVGTLNAIAFDPTSTSSGEFGGEVAALKLNIDFSDVGLITNNSGLKLGDLTLYNFTTNDNLNGALSQSQADALNGQTIRQVLNEMNTVLGGGNGNYGLSSTQLAALAVELNGSFSAGTVSTFAQQHLKKGWKSGDMTTYDEASWGDVPNGTNIASLLNDNYDNVYASTSGLFQIGNGFSLEFTNASNLLSYLPAGGAPMPLNATLIDPTSSPSGIFGGNVATLKLNIDFSDANLLSAGSGLKFGDLVIYNLTTNTDLNGITVRGLLSIANTALGGGSTPDNVTDLNTIIGNLNVSFGAGSPSAWAQLHLKRGWQNGDLTTYNQSEWGNDVSSNTVATLLEANFNTVYASNFGEMFVGGKYIMSFGSAGAVEAYLPQTAAPDTLDSSLGDPTFSASGAFGGEVVNLKLNIDFSDAGLITNNSGLKFGDLTICGFTTEGDNIIGSLTQSQVNALNGKTIRQLLNEMNIVLGAGTGTLGLTVTQLYWLAFELNRSFILGDPNGSPFGEFSSTFTQLHLVNGSCDCGNTVINHCPTATAINISTTVGNAVKFLLQGSDADNNPLTYSIIQAPVHGTTTIVGGDSILYTPTAGYYGADSIKYRVSDGSCTADAMVHITVVVCPQGSGYWKNHPNAWPVSSLMLGSKTYTQSQLITILNTPPGNGNGADATILLADQLITAKLSIANGTSGTPIASTITHADGLLSVYSGFLPYNVHVNTTAGHAMVTDAGILGNFNSGSMTTGCSVPPVQSNSSIITINELPSTPIGFVLEQNHPNPFDNSTIIRYELPVSSHVKLEVFNLLGEKIATLVDGIETAGYKTVEFNANNRSGGIYYYRLTADKFSETKKMVLIK